MDEETLPEEIVERLLDAREATDRTELYALTAGLKEAGWTFADIAVPLGVTRAAVNNWHKSALKKEVDPEQGLPTKPVKITGIVRKIRPDVPPDKRDHIARTAALARQKTRWSQTTSEEYRASQEMERLIEHYIVQRGVSVSSFARHAGVTNRAIAQRLDKISPKGQN